MLLPPERKPLRKKLRLRNRTRLREPTRPCRCRETKQFKNVMPKQRSGATAIFSPRKRQCTATALDDTSSRLNSLTCRSRNACPALSGHSSEKTDSDSKTHLSSSSLFRVFVYDEWHRFR